MNLWMSSFIRAVSVRTHLGDCIAYKIMDVITYPYPYPSQTMLTNRCSRPLLYVVIHLDDRSLLWVLGAITGKRCLACFFYCLIILPMNSPGRTSAVTWIPHWTNHVIYTLQKNMFGCAIYTTDQHCSHVIHSFETHPKQRQEPDYCSQVFCWRSCACVLRASASVPYEHAPDDATSTDQYDFTGTNPPIISVMMANIMEHLASTEYTVSWKSIFMDWLYMMTKTWCYCVFEPRVDWIGFV